MPLAVSAAISVSIPGCQAGGETRGPQAPSPNVDKLLFWTSPSIVHFRTPPGSVGFQAKVFAMSGEPPRAVALTAGELEILVYDKVTGPWPPEAAPRRRWTYGPADLARRAVRSAVGVGYELVPQWEEKEPLKGEITAAARYVPVGGEPVYSEPTTLPSGAK